MDSQTSDSGERLVELALEAGCPQCHGPLQVRVSPRGARAVCLSCQLILAVALRPEPNGLGVAFPVMGQA